jgi:hypothetical protein
MEPVGSHLAILLHDPQLRQGLASRDDRPRSARPRVDLSKRLRGAFSNSLRTRALWWQIRPRFGVPS